MELNKEATVKKEAAYLEIQRIEASCDASTEDSSSSQNSQSSNADWQRTQILNKIS